MNWFPLTLRLSLAVAVALACTSGVAHAVLVAQTGFESPEYTTGMSVDAAGQGAGESGWTSGWTDLYDSNSDIQSVTVNGGSQALQITSYGIPGTPNSAGPDNMYSPRAAYIRTVDRISGPMVVSLSYDLYVDDWGDQGPMLLYVQDSDGSHGPTLLFDTDGTLEAYNDGTPRIDTGVDILEDTWYDIDLVANYGTRQFQLLVDNVDAGTYNFREVGTEGFGRIQFYQQINGTAFYDNVSIEAEESFLGLSVERRPGEATGSITLRNSSGENVEIVGYTIRSASSALSETNWIPITGNYDDTPGTGDGSVDNDDVWTILSENTAPADLSETVFGFTGPNTPGVLANGATIDLGNAWVQNPTEDLVLELLLANGDIITPGVEFTGNGDASFARSDLDFDGDIDMDDFLVYNSGLFTDLSALTLPLAYQQGDIDGDGDNDFDDFVQFKADFDAFAASVGGLTFAQVTAGVPEPSSVFLLVTGVVAIGAALRRRSSAVAALIVVALIATSEANALDLVAQTGFNDASGINSDGTPSSPYESGTSIIGGSGAGEPGWTSDWTWSSETARMASAAPQATETFEGDMALRIDASSGNNASTFFRDFTPLQPGHEVVMSVRVRPEVFTTGTPTMYLMDSSNGGQGAVFWPAADGSVELKDGAPTVEAMPANTFDPNTPSWLQFEIKSDIAAKTFTLSLNGVDSGDVYDYRTGAVNIDRFQIWSNATLAFFDEIVISETPHNEVEQLQLQVNQETGEVSIVNTFGETFSLDTYKITSANGFTPGDWDSLQDQDTANAVPLGAGWVEAGGSTNSLLAETTLTPLEIGASESVSLGFVYDESLDMEDLVFSYRDPATGAVRDAYVSYVTVVALTGDFNDDGIVNLADYTVWRNNLGGPESALNGNGVNTGGSAGVVDQADYAAWKSNFGNTSGAGALQTLSTNVPEPGTATLLVLAAGGLVCSRRFRPRTMARVVTLVITGMLALQQCEAVTVDRSFSMGDTFGEGGGDGTPSQGEVASSSFGSPFDVLDGATGTDLDEDDLENLGGATYHLITAGDVSMGHPGNVGSSAMEFNGAGNFLADVNHANDESFNTIGSGTSQGLQLWVFPHDESWQSEFGQSIVFDSGNAGGPAISPDGMWTQVAFGHSTDIPTSVAVTEERWYHVAQHIFLNTDANAPNVLPGKDPASANTSVIYVDGVAVSALNDVNTNQSVTPFLVGAAEFQETNLAFFDGVLDELEVYSSAPDEFDLFADNDYIANIIQSIPNGGFKTGDITLDGIVDESDADALIAGWQKAKIFEGIHNDVYVGDLETYGWGDLNLDGVVNLADAYILHSEIPGGLNFALLLGGGTQVPEPGGLLLLAAGTLGIAIVRKRA
ncbi:PEP-CTERM sorting domain-containing protein [Aeoliella sp.]|uniref:PEP-CTERM sorting domain-containing protein n=1 Tax=Aeoliella sp. TaxID=2795800 RepID=UPI003CCB7D94